MSSFVALMLGILQGLTEFFPISSSAHLKLAKLLLHQSGDEQQVLFDLFCQGSCLAQVTFFACLFYSESRLPHANSGSHAGGAFEFGILGTSMIRIVKGKVKISPTIHKVYP